MIARRWSPTPPEVHRFIAEAWRRDPRPTLRKVASEAAEKFGRPIGHKVVARSLRSRGATAEIPRHPRIFGPEVHAFVVEARRRDPRAKLHRVAREVAEKFGRRPSPATLYAWLAASKAGAPAYTEAAVRPEFDDPAWLAAIQARVYREAMAEFRNRPRRGAPC